MGTGQDTTRAGTADAGTPRTESGGPTAVVRVSRRRYLWLSLAAAVIVAGLVYALPRLGERSLRDSLAEQLGVADAGTLFLNLPPKPSRYPGSLLLPLLDLPVELVDTADPDLLRSGGYSLQAKREGSSEASGSVATPVFREVLKNKRLLQMQIEVPEGHTVEMSVDRLLHRIQASPTASAATTSGNSPNVIVRAYEGKLVYTLTRGSEASAEAWSEFTSQVQSAGGQDKSTRVEVQGGSHEDGTVRIETRDPVVFAYQAALVTDLLAGAPGALNHPMEAPATAPDPGQNPQRAIDALLKIGPEKVSALNQALVEVGPDAAPAVLKAMEQPDQELRVRGARLLKALPPPAAAAGATRAQLLESHDASVRAWALAQPESQHAAAVPELSKALSDDNAAVRFLATQSLEQLGPAAAQALPALKGRLQDADPSVRLSAASALSTIQPGIAVPVKTTIETKPKVRAREH